MELKIITKEIRAQLRAPLPKEAIKQHPTKTYLNTIKAIYVVERLNDIFGIGKWFQTSEVIKSDQKMIVVKSFIKIPEYGIELEAFGGNDNADQGDAYKGAVTDALTKMCSYIEIGIDVFKGLSDKSENKEKQKTLEEKALQVAIDEIKSQATLDAVASIWKKNKAFQTNKAFIDAKEMMKVALTINQ